MCLLDGHGEMKLTFADYWRLAWPYSKGFAFTTSFNPYSCLYKIGAILNSHFIDENTGGAKRLCY